MSESGTSLATEANFAHTEYRLPPTQFLQLSNEERLAFTIVPPASTPLSFKERKRAPIVLIIGWTGVKEDWDHLPAHLASLGHSVLVFDHLGCGESIIDANDTRGGRTTVEQLADDCAALIRHVFPSTTGINTMGDCSKVHLFGISMGGMIAQIVAARHTELIETLILGCTTISIARPIQPPAITPFTLPTTPLNTHADRRALVEKLLALNLTAKWVNENQPLFQWFVDQSLKWSRPMKTSMGHALALQSFDGMKTVKSIQHIPVLIIHGQEDGIVPVSQAHVLAQQFPNADLALLPQVGHLFWTQAPKQTNNTLAVFLNQQEEMRERMRQQQLQSQQPSVSDTSSNLMPPSSTAAASSNSMSIVPSSTILSLPPPSVAVPQSRLVGIELNPGPNGEEHKCPASTDSGNHVTSSSTTSDEFKEPPASTSDVCGCGKIVGAHLSGPECISPGSLSSIHTPASPNHSQPASSKGAQSSTVESRFTPIVIRTAIPCVLCFKKRTCSRCRVDRGHCSYSTKQLKQNSKNRLCKRCVALKLNQELPHLHDMPVVKEKPTLDLSFAHLHVTKMFEQLPVGSILDGPSDLPDASVKLIQSTLSFQNYHEDSVGKFPPFHLWFCCRCYADNKPNNLKCRLCQWDSPSVFDSQLCEWLYHIMGVPFEWMNDFHFVLSTWFSRCAKVIKATSIESLLLRGYTELERNCLVEGLRYLLDSHSGSSYELLCINMNQDELINNVAWFRVPETSQTVLPGFKKYDGAASFPNEKLMWRRSPDEMRLYLRQHQISIDPNMTEDDLRTRVKRIYGESEQPSVDGTLLTPSHTIARHRWASTFRRWYRAFLKDRTSWLFDDGQLWCGDKFIDYDQMIKQLENLSNCVYFSLDTQLQLRDINETPPFLSSVDGVVYFFNGFSYYKRKDGSETRRVDANLAVKFLKGHLASEDLLTEAVLQMFSQLILVNVPHFFGLIYDHGHDRLGLASERIRDCVTFNEFTEEQEHTNAQRFTVLNSMLRSLHQMHRFGIYHQDLHPGNMLIDAFHVVHVIDFSSATWCDVTEFPYQTSESNYDIKTFLRSRVTDLFPQPTWPCIISWLSWLDAHLSSYTGQNSIGWDEPLMKLVPLPECQNLECKQSHDHPVPYQLLPLQGQSNIASLLASHKKDPSDGGISKLVFCPFCIKPPSAADWTITEDSESESSSVSQNSSSFLRG